MRIKIEVIDKDLARMGNVTEEIALGVKEIFPNAEANFSDAKRGSVEFLVKK